MAVELANAYVTLSVETSSISKQVGRMFGGVESQAGKTGRNMGRSMAESFDKAKPNVDKLSEDVKRAQDRVVAHKDSGSRKMEAANRKVEIAQARVNEVTAKYGEDSSQALRAQDQLVTAQHKAEAETMKYNSSLEKLEGQLKNSQSALDGATRAAENSGSVWDRMGDKLANAGDKMHNVGDRFKAAGRSISAVGSDLTKKITMPIGGAITAAGGLTAALGFKRLVGIDTAKSQIQGLGFDAEKVMQDVDKGLMNTSMSMADGAAVARSALATGNVEIGKDLEAQVNRVANVSAAYGIESAQAGYLLNNVLTKNKVTWGDLSQMQQNQIPIVSQLADHYGVTGEEIQKMASEGQISIEDLNQVLDDSAGQSAEEYAKSWKGITENIGAYISRLGADTLGGLFETMKDEASGLVDILSSEKASEFARALGEQLAGALQKVIGFVRGLVGWFADLSPFWQKIIIGAVGFAVALGPILIIVGKLAAGIGAVIQVFGMLIKVFALVMNPVGLIITAIGLLVGAFIILWNTNEGFRNFFINLWEGIKNFFIGMWENYLQPAFQAMGDFWTQTLVPAFSNSWENVLKPVFEAVGTAVTWLWETILSPVFTWIGDHWQYILLGMQLYWNAILKPVWNAVSAAATWLWNRVLSPVFTWIGDHWQYILLGMQLYWNRILKPTWDRLVGTAQWLWSSVLSPIFTWIGDKWSSMTTSISNVYNNSLKPIFDKFGDIIEDLKDKFKTGVDNIKEQWDKLKGIAADPVEFVIVDIFNDGLINTLNKIPGVNISDVPVPSWVGDYADGGWTGPGSRLMPAGLVHADEYVVRKASRGRFESENPGLLDHINKHGTMAGYDSGGLVRPVSGPLTSLFGAGRGRYPHAGVDWAVPIGTPVRAALAGTALGHRPAGRTGRWVFLSHPGNRNTYYGHLSRPMVSAGDQVDKGQVIGLSGNTGNSTGPHLHFETWTGGKPVNPLSYMGGLPTSADGGEGGGWFDPLAPFRALGAKIKSSIEDKFPGAGYMIDAAAGIAKQGFDDLLEWAKSKIPGLGDPDDGAGGGGGSKAIRSQVQSVADQFGWGSGDQWSAVSSIIQKESSWNVNAANPSSSARGLFQMIAANRSAPYTDVAGHSREGLNYIKNRYGTPTKALDFHNRNNWYGTGGLVRDRGGVVPPGSSVIHNWTRDPEWMYTNKQQDTVQDALSIVKDGAGKQLHVHLNGDGVSVGDVFRKFEFEERRENRKAGV